jgi:putative ATP-binding cassette transporter
MPSYDESRPGEFTSVLMIWLESGTRPILWGALLQPGDSSPGRSDDSSYLPIGALRTALSYPAPEGTFSDERIRETLRLLGFGSLVDRLDETAHWEQSLSGGEQQRLAVARLLLHEPAWIFLDGATSSLDEETEKQIYAVLRERLPRSAIGDAGARIACGVVTK